MDEDIGTQYPILYKLPVNMMTNGEEAFTPNFKAKPSVGFSAAEHPDRPTLLAELAGKHS